MLNKLPDKIDGDIDVPAILKSSFPKHRKSLLNAGVINRDFTESNSTLVPMPSTTHCLQSRFYKHAAG